MGLVVQQSHHLALEAELDKGPRNWGVFQASVF